MTYGHWCLWFVSATYHTIYSTYIMTMTIDNTDSILTEISICHLWYQVEHLAKAVSVFEKKSQLTGSHLKVLERGVQNIKRKHFSVYISTHTACITCDIKLIRKWKNNSRHKLFSKCSSLFDVNNDSNLTHCMLYFRRINLACNSTAIRRIQEFAAVSNLFPISTANWHVT